MSAKLLTIEEIREKLRGLNQAEVAREVGVTRVYISALANGSRDNPSYQVIMRLNEYLSEEQEN